MTDFVVLKWSGSSPKQTYLSGAKKETAYTSKHVNNIEKMLLQSQKEEPRLICITDDCSGLNSSIVTYKIRDSGLEFINRNGGRFFKLFLFSKEFQEFVGKKFIYLDLDVAVCGDFSEFTQISSDLVIMRGAGSQNRKTGVKTFFSQFINTGSVKAALRPRKPWCKFNSSFMVVSPDVGNELWSQFDGDIARKMIGDANLIGTDQAWLHLKFPGTTKTLSTVDGVWRFSQICQFLQAEGKLPSPLKLVIFSGKPESKPWVEEMRKAHPWICEVYPETN